MIEQRNKQNIKNKAINGVFWKFSEKICMQGASLVIQIVLARILLPSDYGIIGYLNLFILLSDVFIQQGFTTALIQKKNADDIDCSSVFFANIIMSIIIYFVLYISAPLISLFYHETYLIPTMRILSLNVIIGAFSSVHNALLAKNLEFKKSFMRSLAYIFFYGASGIILAKLGYGVWALIFARLIGLAVGAIVLWISVKWRPSFKISFSRLKVLFGYSSKVLLTNLLNTLFNNVNSLIIGRFYQKEDLGFFQRGQSIPQAIMSAVDGSLNEVMYPTFSKLQDDLIRLKNAVRRSMRLSMFVIFPILTGLLVISEPLTIVLLTDKWLPSVPYMQLTCIICMFWPLSGRIHALNAIGKSGVTLQLSIISKCISLIFILIMVRFGVLMIMIGTIIASFINFFVTSFQISKYINYSFKELIIDIMPILVLSIIMGLITYSLTFLKLDSLLTLIIQILIGGMTYLFGARIIKLDSYEYLCSVLKRKIKKVKN